MNLIAYGGATHGVVLSVNQFATGRISLAGCLLIILLSVDFFISMRLLGSFFHIAMNGMAASDKTFHLCIRDKDYESEDCVEKIILK